MFSIFTLFDDDVPIVWSVVIQFHDCREFMREGYFNQSDDDAHQNAQGSLNNNKENKNFVKSAGGTVITISPSLFDLNERESEGKKK